MRGTQKNKEYGVFVVYISSSVQAAQLPRTVSTIKRHRNETESKDSHLQLINGMCWFPDVPTLLPTLPTRYL